jgi:hypothetical protein
MDFQSGKKVNQILSFLYGFNLMDFQRWAPPIFVLYLDGFSEVGTLL